MSTFLSGQEKSVVTHPFFLAPRYLRAYWRRSRPTRWHLLPLPQQQQR
jgi:hypothetical protein